jgi:hypothetical protein
MITIEQIKEEAWRLIRTEGLINLTRERLAAAVGIPDGSFPHIAGVSFTALMNELQADPVLMSAQPECISVEKSRTNPELRYINILCVALERARTVGYNNLTRAVVADAAGVSEALVSHYFGTMTELKEVVMAEAVKRGIVEIVAQGLAAGNPVARAASEEVKASALAWMA